MKDNQQIVQGTLFEDYDLIRTLEKLGTLPEVALTELVANAWDAVFIEIYIF